MSVANAFEPILRPNSFYGSEQLRQCRTGNDGVFFLVNAVFFHGFAHPSAQLPQGVTLGGRLSKQDFGGPFGLHQFRQLFSFPQDGFLVGSVHFQQKMRGNVGTRWNAHPIHVPHRPIQGVAFHELQSGRHNAGHEDFGDHGARAFGRFKGGQQGVAVARIRQQAHHDFGHHAQGAFRTHEQLREVVAGGILQNVGAGPDDLAVGQYHFQVQHVRAGNTVLHGFWAAGVVGHVAAQGGGSPRGRVWRIEHALLLAGLVEYLVDDSGLYGCLKICNIDV